MPNLKAKEYKKFEDIKYVGEKHSTDRKRTDEAFKG
jgi:hypothetical protein